jgi:hypothetical protein
MKITKTQLRKMIKEAISEENALMKNINRWSEEGKDIPKELTVGRMRETDPRLLNLEKVTYVEAIPERGASGLYKLELVSKSGKEKELRSIGEFNEMFGTDIKLNAGPRSFGYALSKLAPHVVFEEDEMDVS